MLVNGVEMSEMVFKSKYYSMKYLHSKGWTSKLIEDVLGEPDYIASEYNDPKTDYYYKKERVDEGIENEKYKRHIEKSRRKLNCTYNFNNFRKNINKIDYVNNYIVEKSCDNLDSLDMFDIDTLIGKSIEFYNKKTKGNKIDIKAEDLFTITTQFIIIDKVMRDSKLKVQYKENIKKIKNHPITVFIGKIIMYYLYNSYYSKRVKKLLDMEDRDYTGCDVFGAIYRKLVEMCQIFDCLQFSAISS